MTKSNCIIQLRHLNIDSVLAVKG